MSALVQLRSRLPDEEVEKLIGVNARPSDFAILISGSARVYKPNGDLLLAVVKGGVSEEAAAGAYPFLHGLRRQTSRNRGAFSALGREKPVRKSGVVSKTNETPPIRSAVVGFMDRYPRMPFCRECALSAADPEAWGACLPMIQEVAHHLEVAAPKRYAAQLAAARATHPAYVIPKTPFTTLTVNNTTAGGYHTDAGDFRGGFGAMSVFRAGSYRGCELVVPAYGVAVNLEHRDVILFDVHEVHGNVPIFDAEGPPCEPENGGHERISVVYYFREKMVECLSPAEELERARAARGALDLGDDDPTPLD